MKVSLYQTLDSVHCRPNLPKIVMTNDKGGNMGTLKHQDNQQAGQAATAGPKNSARYSIKGCSHNMLFQVIV